MLRYYNPWRSVTGSSAAMPAARLISPALAAQLAFVLVVLNIQANQCGGIASDVQDLSFTGSMPVSYREIKQYLESEVLPMLPFVSSRIALDTFTPFCKNYSAPEIEVQVEPECVRWEEHELDMLLMYLDLIATGMDKDLATRFYEEIRCLARANIFPIPELKAWEVCFSYDYSEAVGNLLANYVLRDQALKKKEAPVTGTTGRFVFGPQRSSPKQSSFLLSLFGGASKFRLYTVREMKLEGSCCKRCTKSNYFVNIEKNQCLKQPFGKHCCHKACKALGRLKIGASSSTSFCCKRCNPQKCAM